MDNDIPFLTDIFVEELEKQYPEEKFTKETGTKFYKVFKNKDIYAFIEKSTGDCYYPASKKAPAPGGPRANVSTPEGVVDALEKCSLAVGFPKYN